MVELVVRLVDICMKVGILCFILVSLIYVDRLEWLVYGRFKVVVE